MVYTNCVEKSSRSNTIRNEDLPNVNTLRIPLATFYKDLLKTLLIKCVTLKQQKRVFQEFLKA